MLLTMKSAIKRKQFLLPQNLITAVKQAYHARTETEAVVLSLEQALRKKKLEGLANLAGKIKMTFTASDLRRQRARERAY
ncbi:MAG: hypothetical protein HY541_01515 [Deltaproteobacteria bacterium]|nr:hypothetical protein [Deltaproteobacteria bacterium]